MKGIMMDKKYWEELDNKLVMTIKNDVGAVALKFCRTKEELEQISDIVYWPKTASVCKLIGLAAYWKRTVCLTADKLNYHCGGNCGTCERGELWQRGQYLAEVRKWFTPEASQAHTNAQKADVPSSDHIAIVASPMRSGNIPDPDVIVLSTEPAAAFYIFSGLIQRDFHEIDFTFRGESSCVETFCRTYVTGKPGLSLGCRGEGGSGGLRTTHVRYSITVKDLEKALEGCREMVDRDELLFPCYPGDMIEWDKI